MFTLQLLKTCPEGFLEGKSDVVIVPTEPPNPNPPPPPPTSGWYNYSDAPLTFENLLSQCSRFFQSRT